MSNFVSKGVTAYLSINKCVRLFSLILLCPAIVVFLQLLIKYGKGNPNPPLLMLLLIPELSGCLLLSAAMSLFMYEWYQQIVQKIKNIMLANLLVFVGIGLNIYLVFFVSKYIYNFYAGA